MTKNNGLEIRQGLFHDNQKMFCQVLKWNVKVILFLFYDEGNRMDKTVILTMI